MAGDGFIAGLKGKIRTYQKSKGSHGEWHEDARHYQEQTPASEIHVYEIPLVGNRTPEDQALARIQFRLTQGR